MQNNKKISTILKISFIVLCVMFAIPSIIYLVKNGTAENFKDTFTFLLTNNIGRLEQMIIFLILFIIITVLYLLLIKKQKEAFKNIKSVVIFTGIAAIVFAIMLPFTSSDVFYYMGVGWLDSHYHHNPYDISMNEFMQGDSAAQNDAMLAKGAAVWGDQTVVYGPIWAFICEIFATLSMGSVGFGLFIFKVAAIFIHIANTYLIYKITRKKIFSVIYGLNPFILIEAIANVHNDIYVIFFVLLCLYFLIRKKSLVLSTIMLALATCIKYVTVLLLPFIIIYCFRKEKRLGIRLLKCIKYGMFFLFIVIVSYSMYVRNLNVLDGIIDQQGKYTKSIQTVLNIYGFEHLQLLQGVLMIGFAFICIIVGINAITKKNPTIQYVMRQYNTLLYIFIPLIITNFQPWYIMWLFPYLMYQKSSTIKQIIGISILSQIANCTFLLHGENFKYSTQFVTIMAIGIIIIALISNRKIRLILKRKQKVIKT